MRFIIHKAQPVYCHVFEMREKRCAQVADVFSQSESGVGVVWRLEDVGGARERERKGERSTAPSFSFPALSIRAQQQPAWMLRLSGWAPQRAAQRGGALIPSHLNPKYRLFWFTLSRRPTTYVSIISKQTISVFLLHGVRRSHPNAMSSSFVFSSAEPQPNQAATALF